jgi:acyl-CoA thioester hydrolase
MEGFTFVMPLEVRFRDLDAMGHVNNAVTVTYLEMARTAFYRDVFGARHARDFNFIIARVEVDYRRPILFGEPCRVGLRVGSIGRSSFGFDYRLEASEEIAAVARSVQVFYDYERQAKIGVPDGFRERVQPYLAP